MPTYTLAILSKASGVPTVLEVPFSRSKYECKYNYGANRAVSCFQVCSLSLFGHVLVVELEGWCHEVHGFQSSRRICDAHIVQVSSTTIKSLTRFAATSQQLWSLVTSSLLGICHSLLCIQFIGHTLPCHPLQPSGIENHYEKAMSIHSPS